MKTSIETTQGATFPEVQSFLLGSAKTRTALPRPRVLVADDDGQMCLLLAIYLKEAGYDVVKCHDGFELVEHLGSYLLPSSTETYELIISDIRMPHLSGLEILEGLRDRDDFPPMILITAFGDSETHERARKLGAAALLDKPFCMEDLVAKVREIVPIEDSPPSA
jgi:DNA-binding response OmpR family regulator